MPQTNNIITPKERLMIAAQIQAGICAYGNSNYTDNAAMVYTDRLIEQSGCIVEGAEVLTYEMD